MTDTRDELISVGLARLALLTQIVRLLLRERAAENGQTPDDILKWSEATKHFFEQNCPPGMGEAHLTAAADQFFNLLASEVKQDRGSQ